MSRRDVVVGYEICGRCDGNGCGRCAEEGEFPIWEPRDIDDLADHEDATETDQ